MTQKSEIKTSQIKVYCNEVEFLQVTMDLNIYRIEKHVTFHFSFYYMKKWIEVGVVIKQFNIKTRTCFRIYAELKK